MMKKDNSKRLLLILLVVGMLSQLVIYWLIHVKVVFIEDDLWYATNLVTGKPVKGLADIWESQRWHFLNWGGRSVIHFLLQFIIMLGDMFANIMNVIVMLLLCLLICETAGKKSLFYFSLSFFMLISLNPNILFTLFWQSGCVNYLYASTWILFFAMLYLRQLKNPDATNLWGISFWIIPLGFITGWSNENMGPTSFVLTVMCLLYLIKIRKRPPLWMWLGAVTSLVGSILVVVAPGNFVRSSLIKEYSFGMSIYQKLLMMMKAGADFLFPMVVVLLVSMVVYLRLGNQFKLHQMMLILCTVLAFGAMVLSPAFPNRATFGILVFGITAIISFLQGIEEKAEGSYKYIGIFAICMCLRAFYMLVIELQAPLVFG